MRYCFAVLVGCLVAAATLPRSSYPEVLSVALPIVAQIPDTRIVHEYIIAQEATRATNTDK